MLSSLLRTQVVGQGPGRVIAMAAQVATAARMLQQHYGSHVAPVLEGASAASAAAGLADALDRAQALALAALADSLTAFMQLVRLRGCACARRPAAAPVLGKPACLQAG